MKPDHLQGITEIQFDTMDHLSFLTNRYQDVGTGEHTGQQQHD